MAVASAVRAESSPIVSPARCAHTIPAPSRMLNCFDSVPSAWTRIVPSGSTPSTSNKSSLMATMRVRLNLRLNHLRAPQIVQVDDAINPSFVVDNDDGSDFVGFHDPQGFDREHVAGDCQ